MVTLRLPPNQMNISMLTAWSTDWTKEIDQFNDEHSDGKDGSLIKEMMVGTSRDIVNAHI